VELPLSYPAGHVIFTKYCTAITVEEVFEQVFERWIFFELSGWSTEVLAVNLGVDDRE
jgi:hypothetical protein